MKTQLLFNGWGVHYNPDCWFDTSKDNLYVDDNGTIRGFQSKKDGITMTEAYERSKER